MGLLAILVVGLDYRSGAIRYMSIPDGSETIIPETSVTPGSNGDQAHSTRSNERRRSRAWKRADEPDMVSDLSDADAQPNI